jgi:hypothetical protein
VLMLPLKNNLHRRVPGLAYRIAEGNGAGRVEWETEGVDITADEAMAPQSASKGTSKLDEGGPVVEDQTGQRLRHIEPCGSNGVVRGSFCERDS